MIGSAGRLQTRMTESAADFDKFVKSPPTQVEFMRCTTSFLVPGGQQQVDVKFSDGDCQGVHPLQGWTYSASLIGTDICGGFTEYRIDPVNRSIHFWGNFCNNTSSATVDFIGFRP
jgi:hypothetical protein